MKRDVTAGDNPSAKDILKFVPTMVALVAAPFALIFMPGISGALVAIGCLAVAPLSLLLFSPTKAARVGGLVLTLLYLGIIVGVLILQAGQ